MQLYPNFFDAHQQNLNKVAIVALPLNGMLDVNVRLGNAALLFEDFNDHLAAGTLDSVFVVDREHCRYQAARATGRLKQPEVDQFRRDLPKVLGSGDLPHKEKLRDIYNKLEAAHYMDLPPDVDDYHVVVALAPVFLLYTTGPDPIGKLFAIRPRIGNANHDMDPRDLLKILGTPSWCVPCSGSTSRSSIDLDRFYGGDKDNGLAMYCESIIYEGGAVPLPFDRAWLKSVHVKGAAIIIWTAEEPLKQRANGVLSGIQRHFTTLLGPRKNVQAYFLDGPDPVAGWTPSFGESTLYHPPVPPQSFRVWVYLSLDTSARQVMNARIEGHPDAQAAATAVKQERTNWMIG